MMSTYAVPKMTDGHGWEAMLIGEVLILGCVKERLCLIICILSMMIQGIPDRCIEYCVKVYLLYRLSNYSNSRVRGHGQLKWPYYSVVICSQNDL